MTKDKIKKILKTYLEDKPYLYYEEGMYLRWVMRDEIIELIIKDLLNDAYNEEPINDIKTCYYDYKKKDT